MELRHLRYFVILAEELHFGRAASRLAITQPPLSFNIKQLEDELGVVLLKRDNKRVTLTQAGIAFYEEALAIIDKANRAKQLAQAISAGKKGRLDVGFSGSMLYTHLPAIARRFRADWPDVDLVLHELGLPAQITALEHGQLDLAFVDSVHMPSDFEGIQLCVESYWCCVSESHRLADSAQVDIADLANEAFVSFDRIGAPLNFDRVNAMCSAAGFVPRISHSLRQWITVIGLVAQDLGIALVPERMVRSGMAGVRFIPLNSTMPAVSVGRMMWNPARLKDRMEHFIAVARQVLEDSTPNA
jgi:DNA-binding transcriptional LysR family regulator